MLKKENRLPGNRIPSVVKYGRSIFSSLFTLKVFTNKSLLPPRMTIIVSTKVSKRAVDRNKVKRLIRKIVSPMINDFPQNISLVIFVKPLILKTSASKVKTNLKLLIKQISGSNEKNHS